MSFGIINLSQTNASSTSSTLSMGKPYPVRTYCDLTLVTSLRTETEINRKKRFGKKGRTLEAKNFAREGISGRMAVNSVNIFSF